MVISDILNEGQISRNSQKETVIEFKHQQTMGLNTNSTHVKGFENVNLSVHFDCSFVDTSL